MNMTEKQQKFTKWVAEGIENGYMQEIDKQMRLQYGIKENPSEKHWEDAENHFSEK